jgi:hypothetical protein
MNEPSRDGFSARLGEYYGRLPRSVLTDRIRYGARLLYAAITLWSAEHRRDCDATDRQLAQLLGCHPSCIRKYLHTLESRGHVRRVPVWGLGTPRRVILPLRETRRAASTRPKQSASTRPEPSASTRPERVDSSKREENKRNGARAGFNGPPAPTPEEDAPATPEFLAALRSRLGLPFTEETPTRSREAADVDRKRAAAAEIVARARKKAAQGTGQDPPSGPTPANASLDAPDSTGFSDSASRGENSTQHKNGSQT